jgi:hypothetical protein
MEDEEGLDLREAKALLGSMRLNLSDEGLDSLAVHIEYERWERGVWAGGPAGYPELSKGELIRKMKQLQGALNRAKWLYNEVTQLHWSPEEEIPPIQLSSDSIDKLMLSRDPESKVKERSGQRDPHAINVWPLQLMHNLEVWAESYVERTKVQPAWNEGTRIQQKLQEVAYYCNRAGIKISASENSQFYKIAAFVVPEVSDLTYRIKKMLTNDAFKKALRSKAWNRPLPGRPSISGGKA